MRSNLKPFDLKRGDIIIAPDALADPKNKSIRTRKWRVTGFSKYVFIAEIISGKRHESFRKLDYRVGLIRRANE